ncbi:MAG TPA: hypothetical protein PK299_11815 [Anaerolineales bacterium]|nr:hypothetical protein [Anaerolineales bacterium]
MSNIKVMQVGKRADYTTRVEWDAGSEMWKMGDGIREMEDGIREIGDGRWLVRGQCPRMKDWVTKQAVL